MLNLLTILGARPQFIKAAALSRHFASRDDVAERIVHTGQHFDPGMSDIFFEQLGLPVPNVNLGVSGLNHGAMTGRMMEEIEKVICAERPHCVVVYGDTNSTLAGALAAAKLRVPIAHVEAGLRSHNSMMPEEINRVLTDRVSQLLFCPTDRAVENLNEEGFPFSAAISTTTLARQEIFNFGDVMFDVSRLFIDQVHRSHVVEQLSLKKGSYVLATLHRQENIEDKDRLTQILLGLNKVSNQIPVIFLVHPRTKNALNEYGFGSELLGNIRMLAPQPYIETQCLLSSSRVLLTDSGGMQKEAYFFKTPCITVRSETEWTETVLAGWNTLVEAVEGDIVNALTTVKEPKDYPHLYGRGNAAELIVNSIIERVSAFC